MTSLSRIVLICVIIVSASCSKAPPADDESDLARVVDIFYQPGRNPQVTEVTYRLLASKAREQISPDQWRDMTRSWTRTADSAVVLRTATVSTAEYGIVSITDTADGNRTISTATWIKEANQWRRLKLPFFVNDLAAAFGRNDCAAVQKAADAWLALDPFAVEAYESLLRCAGTRKGTGRSTSELLRTLLSINADDTRVLLLQVTHTRDKKLRKQYLQKLQGTSVYSQAVEMIAGGILAGRPSEEPPAEEELIMQKIVVLADIGDRQEFRKIATDEACGRIAAFLDTLDPSDAANYAGIMGLASHRAGDNVNAEKWLDYGYRFDPRNKNIQKLDALFPGKGGGPGS